MSTAAPPEIRHMFSLPTDAIRQIQWRFADRFDLQMLVQSARGVAADRWRAWWRRADAIPTSGPRARKK